MNLFQGEFLFLHSGEPTDFKIDCDALTDEDIKQLAKIIARKLDFGKAYGIPKGGERLALALEPYANPKSGVQLIVDDVLTTGSSFKQYRRLLEKQNREFYVQVTEPQTNIIGVCIFCRKPQNKPDWVTSVFSMDIGTDL